MQTKIRNQIQSINSSLNLLEKDLSQAEEKRLVTSGELRKREDTLVDLSNFKERLEQLAEKGEISKASSSSLTSINDPLGASDVLKSRLMGGKKSQKLEIEEEDPDGEETGNLLSTQRQLVAKQDEHLDSLSNVLSKQKEISLHISEELELQSKLLDDLDDGLDKTQGKMGKANKALNHVAKASTTSKSGVFFVVLLVLLIITAVVVLVVKKVWF